jgi:arylsulfatase
MSSDSQKFNSVKQPNVLVICVDHWPGKLLGASGASDIFTPTLDQLCDNGIRYEQAYSCCPTCIPARRSLMTGTTAKTHGDRTFQQELRMPEAVATLPEIMSASGYQTAAVGKLHVYPQRNRIGFDEALVCEEGRHHLGMVRDDYEQFLADNGKFGAELSHGMGVNQYTVRPWHLDEEFHPTNWITKTMCRTIQRRDPEKPGFWYCSYTAPHPPITPPKDYLDMYRDISVDEPFIGDWAVDAGELPYALKHQKARKRTPTGPGAVEQARKGFYAQCTYIDHQIRLLIGTLWEEGLLDNTAILITSDHGDALGNHGLWAKMQMLESSAKIPMILIPPSGDVSVGIVDDRLACLRDIMPTVLDLCGIPVPASVEGSSLLGDDRRDHLYGEHNEGLSATRMIRHDSYKLIYFPTGHRSLLFDLSDDPDELHDLSDDPGYKTVLNKLQAILVSESYGSDSEWIQDGVLVGLPDQEYISSPDRNLSAQRGWR